MAALFCSVAVLVVFWAVWYGASSIYDAACELRRQNHIEATRVAESRGYQTGPATEEMRQILTEMTPMQRGDLLRQLAIARNYAMTRNELDMQKMATAMIAVYADYGLEPCLIIDYQWELMTEQDPSSFEFFQMRELYLAMADLCVEDN